MFNHTSFFISMAMSSIVTCIILKFFEKRYLDSSKMKAHIKMLMNTLQDIPHITIRIVEKSTKNRYIKLSIAVDDKGVIDALMGNSPMDKVKERINQFTRYMSPSGPYKIEIFLED